MRLRITFSKTGALRYTGHLDLHKIWERTVRRAGLSLAYTHGFHPGPRLQLACALPLGFSSRAEIADVWLDDPPPADPGDDTRIVPYRELLQAAAPPGLTVLEVAEMDPRLPSLQTLVASAEYEVTLLDPPDVAALTRGLSALLEAGSLPRERRGKTYDLRPLIEEVKIMDCAGSPAHLQGQTPAVQIFMRLSAREGATGRPEEVLDALGIPIEDTRIERTRLVFKTEIPAAA
jgi:radical SAM-linked protein